MSNFFDINVRAQEILKHLVDVYIDTGEPVGSRTLARSMGISLSPATIRGVMSDLEDAGLLYSPHTSAGRVPTDKGFQMFVQALLEVGDLSLQEKDMIERQGTISGGSVGQALEKIVQNLAGLTKCAGLVIAPKGEAKLKHIEFVYLAPQRVLIVIVTADGLVENRIIETPEKIDASILQEASNFLNHLIANRTLDDIREIIQSEIQLQKAELNELTLRVLKEGLAIKSHFTGYGDNECYIVRGRSHLLENVQKASELDQIRRLFEALDTKEMVQHLLDLVIRADGVQIFIGSENSLFNLTGCSVIMAPCVVPGSTTIGAIGVVGPSRINYGRIVSLVDFTTRIIEKMS